MHKNELKSCVLVSKITRITRLGYFRVLKSGLGRVRVYPTFEITGSGMSGIEKSRVQAGIFGFGYTRTHH